ncbi:tetratricopeptide repeat protein [Hazenella sp. IB182357]|uniref:Tetratricopeptide repeat protein n=1 Tax=Polycladospora coralii TaxID=2771432 RepID=A0A926NAU5_9BACL|nr:tetratricopeptide repeat protein [Polycladospora coralii]MBD1372235.1 tetratricopeptide repeat protein [Polycladospora coralii]MBS7530734.1 tetratricopeptide repeat protein [Polycladospora coralii]
MKERLDWIISEKAKGNIESAQTEMLKLVSDYPDDVQAQLECAYFHDSLGFEKEAVTYYEKALSLGIPTDQLSEALLGLGSTYRCLGEYEKSRETLERGIQQFPEDRPLHIFLSLTLYNLHQHDKAMEILLSQLLETTSDSEIQQYSRALHFYKDQLDATFMK